jgi:hypothetical protein
VADGGLAEAEINNLTGTLKVMNNFFGKPVSPADNFNNLMHFSNCNLELEISENEIEDACWGGFLVWGNKGHSKITRNTINKTKTYQNDGVAISVGVLTPNYVTPYAYNGSAEITDNKITIGSANSSGILIANYPFSQNPGQVPIPDGISFVVSGNTLIMMNDSMGYSPKYALGCLGACSNTTWRDNTVTGMGSYGIYLSKSLPAFAPQANIDAFVTNNSFENIDMRGFAALNTYVLCDQYAIGNTGTNIGVPKGSCSTYIQDAGINNTFNRLPEIIPIAPQVAYVGSLFELQVLTTHESYESYDVLTYGAAAAQWLSINPASGKMSGTPTAPGKNDVAVTVTDNKCGMSSSSFVIDVRCPPLVVTSLAASPNLLWPPNHKLVPVALSATTSGGCGQVSCQIVGVSSNEPASADGDWQITGPLTLLLRADRLGAGSGRVYTITVQCTDEKGNTASRTVTVTVPHDQGK